LDLVVLALDTDGSYLWDWTAGGAARDLTTAIALDGSGATNNVVVTGYTEGPVDFGGGVRSVVFRNAFVVALDRTTGGYRWDWTAGEQAASQTVEISPASGNVLAGGSFVGNGDFGGGLRISSGNADAFVVSLDSAGTYQWDWRCTAGATDDEGVSNLWVSDTGTLVAAGSYEGTMNCSSTAMTSRGGTDGFAVALEPTGAYRWQWTVGGTLADAISKVEGDGAGNFYASGYFEGSVDFGSGTPESTTGRDPFLVFLTFAGIDLPPLYLLHWRADGAALGSAADVEYDALSANLIVGGFYQQPKDFGAGVRSNAGGSDIFVVGVSLAATHAWDFTYGGLGSDVVKDVGANSTGRVAIVGSATPSTDTLPDLYIAWWDAL
jgi:hypothetical protein